VSYALGIRRGMEGLTMEGRKHALAGEELHPN
jgi:hypothetical protein